MTIISALITTSAANIYVSNGNTAITFLSITNYSNDNALANVHVVESGSSANVQNQVLTNLEITAGETYQFYAGGEKLLLENDQAIVMLANANSKLSAVTSYTSI